MYHLVFFKPRARRCCYVGASGAVDQPLWFYACKAIFIEVHRFDTNPAALDFARERIIQDGEGLLLFKKERVEEKFEFKGGWDRRVCFLTVFASMVVTPDFERSSKAMLRATIRCVEICAMPSK